MAAKTTFPWLVGLALALAAPAPAVLAQMDIHDLARLQEMTPPCRNNPDAPWIGRFASSYDGTFDRPRPFSLVGCFPTEAACTAWLQRVSGRAPGPFVQYNCSRRR